MLRSVAHRLFSVLILLVGSVIAGTTLASTNGKTIHEDTSETALQLFLVNQIGPA